MTDLKHLFAAMAIGTSLVVSAQTSVRDLQSDTWVGVDALQRVLPTSDDAPLKTDKDRIVSIFYVSWHTRGYHTSNNGYYGGDVTKTLQKDPEARKNQYNSAWEEYTCHWGEPEDGYFLSADPYIIRKDISMLNDAGVDLLVLDCTNGVVYREEWDALLDMMNTMRAEGTKTPKVCFWVFNGHPTSRARNIYDYYYVDHFDKYKDNFFYLDGKPLLLCNMRPEYDANKSTYAGGTTGYTFADYGQDVIDFFTMRNMWWGYYAWPVDASTVETPSDIYIGQEDKWTFGYDMHDPRLNSYDGAYRASYHNGEIEQMSVTPAQHAINMIGKSWKVKKGLGFSTGDYNLNEYDLPKRKLDISTKKWMEHPEEYGIYFQERWNEALAADPTIVFINDWNEWIAGMFGGNYTFMGRENNNFAFVDQYNAEFNRTVMPMKDGYTDNYYMQMVDNVRKYKGVRTAPVAESRHTLRAADDFALWNDVTEEYFDTYGDVAHRDFDGYGGMHYTNESGRNDFVSSKVAVDNEVVSFYVETASEITPCTDPNWMLLFINTDRDFTTGWGGFDYMIDNSGATATTTTLKSWDKASSSWIDVQSVNYRVSGNRMVVEIPLASLGISVAGNTGLYFKWADNPADLNDPISLCVNGDTAPNRRFCYDYSWNFDTSGIDDVLTDASASLVVNACGTGLYIETAGNFVVSTVTGVVVARGNGTSYLPGLADGLYIVTNGKSAVKVVL